VQIILPALPRIERLFSALGLAFWMALAFVAAPAAASLGGDEATIAVDQAVLAGSMKVSRVQRFAVHEIAAPSGTVVRQYVSPAGMVFGVAWSGPTMPDLRQVLGSYYDTYVEAAAKRKARGPVKVELPGLVVQSSGHMRAFVGSAYLPGGVPKGVATDEIK
jgi:hypothetical protein